MAGPIENFIVLEPGVGRSLHFRDHAIVDRVITDPVLKERRTVQSLLFYVDEEDGRVVDKTYSIVSQKHAAEFTGYLEGKRYRGYVFTIIKDAPGTVPPRIAKVVPR